MCQELGATPLHGAPTLTENHCPPSRPPVTPERWNTAQGASRSLSPALKTRSRHLAPAYRLRTRGQSPAGALSGSWGQQAHGGKEQNLNLGPLVSLISRTSSVGGGQRLI